MITAHLLEFAHWQRDRVSREIDIPTSFFQDAWSPTAAAAVVRTKLAHGETALARHLLDLALKRYAVTAPGPLTRLADQMVRAGHAPGWIGTDARLALRGRVSPQLAGAAIEVTDGQHEIASILAAASGAFRLAKASPLTSLQLVVRVAGQPLLGGALAWPPAFDVEGATHVDPELDAITGWVRIRWLGALRPKLERVDDLGATEGLDANWDSVTKAWTFRTGQLKTKQADTRSAVRVVLPDGRTQTLPGAPLVPRALAKRSLVRTVSAPEAAVRSSALVTGKRSRGAVVVVIVLGRDELDARPCLEALLEQVDARDRLLVVDAGSPDQHLVGALERLQAEGRLDLLRIHSASSHAEALNHAFAVHSDRDVVLIDPLAVVMPGSLSGLLETAHTSPDCGTVSALSNQVSPAAYPSGTSHGFSLAHAETLVRAFEASSVPALEIPVLSPACVFIRRACLDDVGPLDAQLFPERDASLTDFSMQATRRRWVHRLAPKAFAYLAGSAAWQAPAGARSAADDALLRTRHPAAMRSLDRFRARDPLHALRRSLDEHQLRHCAQGFVLVLTLARGGGVDRFVAERCTAIRQQGFSPLLLRAQDVEQGPVMLWTDQYPAHDLVYHPEHDRAQLQRLLAALPIHRIELQHFLGIAPAVVEACLGLGPPCDIFVHDYIWICPRLSLMGPAKQYCGEPASTRTCDQCVRTMGSTIGEPGITTRKLRERSARWLASARRVIVPSADVAQRLQRYFPGIEWTLVPHESVPERVTVPARGTTPIRIGLLGSLTRHKGYEVLLRCARHVRRHELPLEFVLIGSSMDDDTLLKTGCIAITGPYSDHEVADLITRERLDAIWLPSVWPETWSYTLTHAIRSGHPIVAFNIGAIGERIRALQCGILSPLNAGTRELVATLIKAAAPAGLGNKLQKGKPVIGS